MQTSDNGAKAAPRVTMVGLLKLQLLLAPLCCSWFYASVLAQERQIANSTSLSFMFGVVCAAMIFATGLSIFRLRAFPNDALFVPALRYGIWYSVFFGMLAWGPVIILELVHSLDEFLPKFIWLQRSGELNSLSGCRSLLHGAWLEFHRPLSWLLLLFGFYGFLGLGASVCSTTLIQIARLLFPQLQARTRSAAAGGPAT